MPCVYMTHLERDRDQNVSKLRPINKTPQKTTKETITNTALDSDC